MDTLQRLSIQSKKLDPVSEKVLNEMASREVTGQIITEWVLANDSQEDEDEEARKSSHMSPTALYHSQGKEH